MGTLGMSSQSSAAGSQGNFGALQRGNGINAQLRQMLDSIAKMNNDQAVMSARAICQDSTLTDSQKVCCFLLQLNAPNNSPHL